MTDQAPQGDLSRNDPVAGVPSGASAPVGDPPVIALRGLSKTFGGARALDSVDMTIQRGEIHGLLGENGSGKSTLIKILAGFHAPDEGELEVNGVPVGLPLHPGQFATLGLSFVHQDLGLLRELTVLENLRMIELAQSHSWRINWRAERRKARALFEEFGVDLDPDALVNDISETDRALLAIVRATEDIRTATGEDRRGLLVLDEPTVFLPREGVERLFAITRSIVEEHASVLFVGHDLDEVREITDIVTVLRDGRVHGTVKTAEASEAEIVEMIIGRRLAQLELHRAGREHARHGDLGRGPDRDEGARAVAGGPRRRGPRRHRPAGLRLRRAPLPAVRRAPVLRRRAAHGGRDVLAGVDDAAARAGRRHLAHPRRPAARRQHRLAADRRPT